MICYEISKSFKFAKELAVTSALIEIIVPSLTSFPSHDKGKTQQKNTSTNVYFFKSIPTMLCNEKQIYFVNLNIRVDPNPSFLLVMLISLHI